MWTAGGFVAVLLVPVPAGAGEGAPDPAGLQPVWQLGKQSRFHEAEAALSARAAGDEADFTRAVLQFNRQPRTEANMDAAVAIFSVLAERAATPAQRARNLYFWARAQDLRQMDQSPDAAVKLYERLWREHPDQKFGQRALVHRLLREFYSDDPRETVLARCAALEQEAAGITDPTVQSHFHQVAARGYLHLGGAAALALRHLLAVEQLGVARREAQGDLRVSIGQLAAELGQSGLAREHYAAFLREFPHDARTFTVRALLTALPAEGSSAP